MTARIYDFPGGSSSTPRPLDTGDIVTLLTGGPDLVVLEYCDDCGAADVAWFDGDSLEIANLPAAVLVLQ